MKYLSCAAAALPGSCRRQVNHVIAKNKQITILFANKLKHTAIAPQEQTTLRTQVVLPVAMLERLALPSGPRRLPPLGLNCVLAIRLCWKTRSSLSLR